MAVRKPGKRTMVTTRTPAGFTSLKNKMSKKGNKATPEELRKAGDEFKKQKAKIKTAKPTSSGMSIAVKKPRTSAQQKTKTLPYSGGKPKAKKMPGSGGAPKVRKMGR
jgi:hypothetical protein